MKRIIHLMKRNLLRAALLPAVRCLLFGIVAVVIVGCAGGPPPKPTGEYYWPTPPDPPKIKWVTWWTGRRDFEKSSSVLTFLLGEERSGNLLWPNGLATDLAGNLYVADSDLAVIFVFDFEKNDLRFLGEGTLAGPISLAMDNKAGVIYATDTRQKKVVGIDIKSDRVVMSVGATGEFKNPSGVAFDEEKERLYVSDSLNHTIRVYDKHGKYLFNIGTRGVGDGEFNFPSYLVFRNGRLYVADTLNYRIQILDGEGKFIKKFGQIGDSIGSFARPKGIGVDSEGHVYVVDPAFNAFQVFDEDGHVLLSVGQTGRGPGGFDLPSGLYVDRQDRIYVSDTLNRRVQVFQYLKEGSLPGVQNPKQEVGPK